MDHRVWVLGSLLWNAMHNRMLALPIPEEATIVGLWMNDITVIVTAKLTEQMIKRKRPYERTVERKTL